MKVRFKKNSSFQQNNAHLTSPQVNNQRVLNDSHVHPTRHTLLTANWAPSRLGITSQATQTLSQVSRESHLNGPHWLEYTGIVVSFNNTATSTIHITTLKQKWSSIYLGHDVKASHGQSTIENKLLPGDNGAEEDHCRHLHGLKHSCFTLSIVSGNDARQ